jgi:hypothetical protein
VADSYTTSLRIVQMPTGSNNGLWGDKADAAFAMLEQAVTGAISISLAGGDHTLTTANNASDEARNKVISFTGAPGTTRTVTMPNVPKFGLMINSTDSSVIFTSGAGLSAVLLAGQVGFVLTDGATNTYSFVIADVAGKGILAQVYAPESM